jgi:antitoxin component of MazEF toxin-antitoxin module
MQNLIFLKAYLNKYPNATIKSWGNAAGLSQKSVDRLIRWNIVKNNGTTRNPKWEWIAGEPTDRMYNEVFSETKVFKRKRRKRRTKTVASKPKTIFDVLMKYPNISVTINSDVIVEIKSSDDITISRNNTRMKVENLTMLENILSLTA